MQSGLIATNSRELAALRAVGERDYYEFQIAKSKQPHKVGNVQLQLTRADPQRNKYSLQLIADDEKDREEGQDRQRASSNSTSPARGSPWKSL